MSALFQGFKQGARRALVTLVAAIVVLGVGGFIVAHIKSAHDRHEALDSYAIKAEGLLVERCFSQHRSTTYVLFAEDEETSYILDEQFDGNFYECVEDAYTTRYMGTYGKDIGLFDPASGRGYIKPYGYYNSVKVFNDCFAGMNGGERRSLDAADCVIKAAGPYEAQQLAEAERYAVETENQLKAERDAAQKVYVKAYTDAKPVVTAAIETSSPSNDADYRAAAVLASCKYGAKSGGYGVAFDTYVAHSQQAVVAQRNIGELFTNARDALCNAS